MALITMIERITIKNNLLPYIISKLKASIRVQQYYFHSILEITYINAFNMNVFCLDRS